MFVYVYDSYKLRGVYSINKYFGKFLTQIYSEKWKNVRHKFAKQFGRNDFLSIIHFERYFEYFFFNFEKNYRTIETGRDS